MIKYEDHLDIDKVLMYIDHYILDVEDKYDLKELVNKVWDDGWDSGWQSGYNDGYDEGRSDGFEDDLK